MFKIKNFIFATLLLSPLLTACSNGAPSKKDITELFNSQSNSSYRIKISKLHCNPTDSSNAVSCTFSYKRYWTKYGEDYYGAGYRASCPEGTSMCKTVREGVLADERESYSAIFKKQGKKWSTDRSSVVEVVN